MRAFALTAFDEPPRMIDVPEPQVGANEVLIRVAGSSVNPVDRMVATGFFRAAQEYRFPAVFGRDVSGVVERTGAYVTRFRPGDRVFGFVKRPHIGDGTFAELVASPDDEFVASLPPSVPLEAGGVLGLAGITALECVADLAAGAGDVVLVSGATGGVGCFAVQLAVARGATVVATARSDAGAEFVRGLGASVVVDWADGDVGEQVRAQYPDGIAGVIDLVNRDRSHELLDADEPIAHGEFARLCEQVLRPDGRAVSTTNGGESRFMGDRWFRNVHSTPTRESLDHLGGLVERGAVVAPIAERFDFADIAGAFGALADGGRLGKIAIGFEG